MPACAHGLAWETLLPWVFMALGLIAWCVLLWWTARPYRKPR